jgi:hypothetical protein
MKKIITALAVLVLTGEVVAFAQSGNSGSNYGGSSSGARNGGLPPAPIGHRQPRAGDVPSEKSLNNPDDQANKEDAALDRKIKSICRGC